MRDSSIGSPEFYAKSSGTDLDWVDAMYQNLLGRPADAQGEQYWIAVLAEGTCRSSVAYGFTDSVEREEQRIALDYQQYLGRDAGQNGLNYWVTSFVTA